jgi:hypothetical protein
VSLILIDSFCNVSGTLHAVVAWNGSTTALRKLMLALLIKFIVDLQTVS